MSLLPSGRLKIDGDRKNMPYLVQAPCHLRSFMRNVLDVMQIIEEQCVSYIKRDESPSIMTRPKGKDFPWWDAGQGFLPLKGDSGTGPRKTSGGSWLLCQSVVATWAHCSKIWRSLLGGRVPSFAFDVNRAGRGNAWAKPYSSRRPSMALSMVISSAYSMSLPTGIPIAMRVTLSPARRS